MFDQCGHYQVLKIMDEEIPVICVVALVSIYEYNALNAHAC
jgi:hypothetical protein